MAEHFTANSQVFENTKLDQMPPSPYAWLISKNNGDLMK